MLDLLGIFVFAISGALVAVRKRLEEALVNGLPVQTVRTPPSGIASRALSTRFITTCSIWPASANTGASVRSRSVRRPSSATYA